MEDLRRGETGMWCRQGLVQDTGEHQVGRRARRSGKEMHALQIVLQDRPGVALQLGAGGRGGREGRRDARPAQRDDPSADGVPQRGREEDIGQVALEALRRTGRIAPHPKIDRELSPQGGLCALVGVQSLRRGERPEVSDICV